MRTSSRPVLLSILVLGLAGALTAGCAGEPERPPARRIVTNEAFINGLYMGLDLTDQREVFRFVFSQLDDEVTVYPSENYYYFEFTARGKTLAGSISLFPEDRDSARVGFGYATRLEDKARHKRYFNTGEGAKLTAQDGVRLEALDAFTYAVRFEGKTVRFHLYNPGLEPPQKAALRPDERFVGPSFDESGLRFYLLFNETTSKLFWILNEDGFVPETFRTTDIEGVVIGDRTEFAFYVDSVQTRKILIGVAGLNVLHNNWYDGPFDQMPDNYVYTGQIDLKKYLMAHYGYEASAIDDYGNYGAASRVPVAPYTVYFSEDALRLVETCTASEPEPPAFYACLTRQVFEIPEDFYQGVRRTFY